MDSTSTPTVNYIQTTIPILKKEAYHIWSIQMKTLLISQDLWELVEKESQEPANQEELSQWPARKRKEYKQNQQKDAKALYFLQQGVDPAIFLNIMSAKTSQEAWKILESKFKEYNKMTDNGSGRGNGNPPSDEEKRLSPEKLKLYRAALDGDWELAKYILHKEGIHVKISGNEDTALHVAAAAKRFGFVKELVKKMNEKDFEMTNTLGQTALFLAATSGMVKIAKKMIKKNKRIAMITDKEGTLPIHMAAALGHEDMVKYLYQETKGFLEEEVLKDLFIRSIEVDLYDIALQLLADYQDLDFFNARREDKNKGVTALHVLARKHPTFCNLSGEHHRSNFKRFFNYVSGAKDVEKKKQQALELVKRIWKRVILLSEEQISKLIGNPTKLIFEAAERGNVELLSILIREYPDLIYRFDNRVNKYSIFHYAVKYRQENVFNLIDEIGLNTEIFLGTKDEDGNNILHLAGMLAPSDRLNIEPGPVIQMRRELTWFQNVEKIVPPSYAEVRNRNKDVDQNDRGFTPRELFTKQHKDLRDKAEEWMNNTTSSFMVVAALIATVAFAAAITVPGGNNGDTGFPIFHEKHSFKIFAISDAISLVFSSLSIVIFLSISTSSFAEEDFLWLLPLKLVGGLATLFISMAAMMIVFSTTFFILFNDTRLWIAILVTVMSSMPMLMLPFFYKDLLKRSFKFLSNLHFLRDKISLFGRQKGKSDDQSRVDKKSNGCPGTCSTNV